MSRLLSKDEDAFLRFVYGSSFVSGLEKCIRDHRPITTKVVQSAGPEIFLVILSSVIFLSKLFFCCVFLLFI